ncbi:hypothetical protein ACFSQT_26255 [Mesorhizobium calcicola]|uniref:Transposase n=1 Tax=Mesorhizobium calcicola TaxID=1300310 RepID=A0ABW4WIR2_9HYPH
MNDWLKSSVHFLISNLLTSKEAVRWLPDEQKSSPPARAIAGASLPFANSATADGGKPTRDGAGSDDRQTGTKVRLAA